MPRGPGRCAGGCSRCSPTRRAPSTCCCSCGWPPSCPPPGIVTSYCVDRVPGSWAVALAVVVMVVVSYVLVGVAPRTIGRQQAERVALVGAPRRPRADPGVRPAAPAAHPARQRAHARQGLPRGPVRLRGRAARPRRPGAGARRRRGGRARHDRGRLRARRHARPRGHGAAHRHGLHRARQDGPPGAEPGAAQRLQPHPGRRRERRRRASASPTSRTSCASERADGGDGARVEEVMRPPVFVPESKPVDDLLREMQSSLGHIADRRGRVRRHRRPRHHRGRARGDRRRDRRRVRQRDGRPVEQLDADTVRVTARLPVEDLEELFDVELPHEDVETVGGLLASALGRVPIPGATDHRRRRHARRGDRGRAGATRSPTGAAPSRTGGAGVSPDATPRTPRSSRSPAARGCARTRRTPAAPRAPRCATPTAARTPPRPWRTPTPP